LNENRLNETRSSWLKGLPILVGIWLVGAAIDRTWLAIDHSMPPWDPADYLTGALVYWNALATPQWFSSNWWTDFWLLSSKIPPFFYISTAPFLTLFGTGTDQSLLVMLLYSAILLASVYALGIILFDWKVGLWAAVLSTVIPSFYQLRLEFLLDYPLTAMVTLSFTCLTLWRNVSRKRSRTNQEKIKQDLRESTEICPPTPNAGGARDQSSPALGDLGGEVINPATQSDEAPDAPKVEVIEEVQKVPEAIAAVSHSKPTLALRFKPQFIAFSLHPWLLAIVFGITLGLALMTKQTALLFLLVPMLWVLGEIFWRREWQRFGQFVLGLAMSLPVWFPWYRTNWLLILTSSKRATIDSAIAEGQAPLWSLRGWTLYLTELPGMVSLPLLVVPLLGLALFWRRSRIGRGASSLNSVEELRNYRQQRYAATQQALGWLLIFILGAYLLSTLNPNKDARYIAPYLPALAVILAYGITLFPKSWRVLPWATISLATVLMLNTLFPIFAGQSAIAQSTRFFPHQGKPYPHAQVISAIVQADPYLISTVGVLPSTLAVNQHNINYYGILQNSQVFGRQVGDRQKNLEKDRRSLTWFLTKTGDQGAIRRQDTQTALVQAVEQGQDFQLHQTWALPDESDLKLYRRKVAAVEVKEAEIQSPTPDIQSDSQNEEDAQSEGEAQSEGLEGAALESKLQTILNPQPVGTAAVKLDQLTLPIAAPPGKPIPVTYQWSGKWEALQPGLVILTWRKQGDRVEKGSTRWFHDHGIGKGELHPAILKPDQQTHRFQVTERMAMLPPKDAAPGSYTLEATYLNRRTGKTEAIVLPPVSLILDPAAAATPAPELDLPTQLRTLAATLPQGVKSLETISNEIARINQYDPVQDYLIQVQQATEYRLKQEPKQVQHAYTLALATALRRQVNPAIAALEKATQLDSKNPYSYAYLAFVNLYDFRPGAAQTALQTAHTLNPNSPEIKALSSVASLMQGNLIQAWQHFQAYQKAQVKG
jgi:4-amino-4-deoxy-L-arabinose transferase-like glycosyltransferase